MCKVRANSSIENIRPNDTVSVDGQGRRVIATAYWGGVNEAGDELEQTALLYLNNNSPYYTIAVVSPSGYVSESFDYLNICLAAGDWKSISGVDCVAENF